MADLNDLFAKDPLHYTEQDLTEIITKYRASRHQFAAGNKKAGSAKPPTEKQKELKGLASKLDLGDLFGKKP